ncbi:uncharacterized protein K452DRAFT_294355 [Aplosporella prunicola CBS 121167]|uniref:P/Homo B domain-containing protein n=1 Tax=Aplosporella prunicola CBS 121167 TaxID=1176127 RepID=A0A6A6BS41_9PEZI|nr:uncharacterized protein K452DRAFT_294355 [Aplosporella prunicola CBS 121167]KAF2146820.1 hypothetical protein K452DRAFT_294355 [Aplosporella prunicola CBS 121167]
MRASLFCTLLAATTTAFGAKSHRRPRNYETHDFYALELDASSPPAEVAAALGLEYEGEFGELQGHHVFSAAKHDRDMVGDAMQELKRRKRGLGGPSALDGIRFHQKQVARKRLVKRIPFPAPADKTGPVARAQTATSEVAALKQQNLIKTLGINDPIFPDQWHLLNTEEVGNDLNVTGLWLEGITGKGVGVCIVDDGLDMYSDDLKDNYFAKGSYDFNDIGPEPKPRLSDDKHGTRCAGEVAAGKNNACGVGVAWDSRISGVRILSGPLTDEHEAESMNFAMNEGNDIYSCSWGPADDGQSMDAPGILIKRAMVNGVQNGRGGKGSIYVFAAGNGAAAGDNCNFDGYTNSIYSVTVGAIEKSNEHPYYSEKCSAQLVVTYSSGRSESIHTTDVGTNVCSNNHGGTSAAGPLGAGIYALALQARPELTWRDIQWLTVNTAVQFDQASDWQDTPYGRKFSHQFGYGKLDAFAFVQAAKTWDLVKPQAWFFSPWMHVKTPIPQGDKGLVSRFDVTEEALKKANFERIEHVTVTMNVEHTRRGDLSVELRSPSGIVSHLSVPRHRDSEPAGYVDWTFMSVAHWGESGVGTWTVIVKDTVENEYTGTFTDWKLRLWGECKDAASQQLLPMPTEHDDDDHDVIVVDPHTTSISVPTATGSPEGNPSDHPDRPVKPKPTASGAAVIPSKPGSTGKPVQTAPVIGNPSEEEEAQASASATPGENFLPSPFPTFGVSKRTQGWIYASLGLILAFCGSLAVYFWWARRKRLRSNPRSEYEFELVDDGGDEPLTGGAAGGRKGKRRAGELYDAFAGESDEDLFSDDDDDDAHAAAVGGAYRDHGRYDEDDEDAFDEKSGLRQGMQGGGGGGAAR